MSPLSRPSGLPPWHSVAGCLDLFLPCRSSHNSPAPPSACSHSTEGLGFTCGPLKSHWHPTCWTINSKYPWTTPQICFSLELTTHKSSPITNQSFKPETWITTELVSKSPHLVSLSSWFQTPPRCWSSRVPLTCFDGLYPVSSPHTDL
jgi:hypothetical protein